MAPTSLEQHEKSRHSLNFWRSNRTLCGSSFLSVHLTSVVCAWEAAVKSLKTNLRHVTANTKFTFEEFITVLTQVEASLLSPLPCDDDGIEALTPGHFIVGNPLEALPDSEVQLILDRAVVRLSW